MNFCINCKHYSGYEGQRETVHSCLRDSVNKLDLVTGRQLPGYSKNAVVERKGDPSAGYCGEMSVFFVAK